MSPEEIRELWSRFLSGEKLSAAAQKELVEALDADSELRDSLLENLQLDGMLRALDTTRRQGEAFVRTMTECVGAEGDATRFIEKVELRLNEPEPPAPTDAAGTGRRTKPPTTRVFRRRSAASAQGETAWKPALIAAAALVVILLLVTSPKPPPSVARPPAPKQAPDLVPPPLPPPPFEEKQKPELPKNEPGPSIPLIAPKFPEPKPETPSKPPTLPEENPRRPEPDPSRRPDGREGSVVAEAGVPATVESFEEFVFWGSSNTQLRQVTRKGELVLPGNEVRTKAASSVVLVYEDGTRVALGANSSLKEEPPLSGRGRRLVLQYGSLESHITRQHPDRPMVFASLTAEATIVGTTVRLTVSHDPKVGTTLEVKEGKVLFARLSDKKTVEVTTGQFAIVADGAELKPAKKFPDELLVKFGPSDVKVKFGQVLDTGEEFDAVRGYGWKGPKNGPVLPGMIDPVSGLPVKTGRSTARRTTVPDTDPLRSTDVVAGWGPHFEIWTMPVPNGKYLVTVCCGDLSCEQGPHHVEVEGVQVINAMISKTGKFIEEPALVEVKDGELTMKVGGYMGKKLPADRSVDTIINFLSIKKVSK